MLAAGGCLPVASELGGDCMVDADCGSGQCTRTGECVARGTALAVRVVWTLDGAAPTSESCLANEIAEMSLTFIDRETQDGPTYQPIPCQLGRILYDVMPPRFDYVSLSALQEDGSIRGHVGEVPIPRDGTPVEMDFIFTPNRF